MVHHREYVVCKNKYSSRESLVVDNYRFHRVDGESDLVVVRDVLE